MWHLYMLRTRNGSLYTGIATDVARRVKEHQSIPSRGAKSLRGRGPVHLAFHRRIGDHALALKVERCIKRLSKPRKENLVASKPGARKLLQLLAVRRTPTH